MRLFCFRVCAVRVKIIRPSPQHVSPQILPLRLVSVLAVYTRPPDAPAWRGGPMELYKNSHFSPSTPLLGNISNAARLSRPHLTSTGSTYRLWLEGGSQRGGGGAWTIFGQHFKISQYKNNPQGVGKESEAGISKCSEAVINMTNVSFQIIRRIPLPPAAAAATEVIQLIKETANTVRLIHSAKSYQPDQSKRHPPT